MPVCQSSADRPVDTGVGGSLEIHEKLEEEMKTAAADRTSGVCVSRARTAALVTSFRSLEGSRCLFAMSAGNRCSKALTPVRLFVLAPKSSGSARYHALAAHCPYAYLA